MNELVLIACYAAAAWIAPLLLLAWFGGHRFNLKCLAAGKPAIHVPSKHEPSIWLGRCGALEPREEPLRYLGATASAGTLRRWSLYMAAFCLVTLGAVWLPSGRIWCGVISFFCLLLVPLYLGDIPLVSARLKRPVMLFALLHLSAGLGLCLISVSKSAIVLYLGSMTSLAGFVWLSRIPVPPDDIVHQVAAWRRSRKHLR